MPPRQYTRLKAAAVDHPVPQSREEVIAAVREIGEQQRTRVRIETEMNDALAAVRETYERQAAPLAARIQALTRGVQTWCEAHRDELTQGGKVKTARLASGEVLWRTRPPSVRITGAEAVIDALKRLHLGRFVRAKEEVNKEAILNEPEAVRDVRGITISQGEDFVIKPFETELEEVV